MQKLQDFFAMLSDRFNTHKPTHSENVSSFVKRMRELDTRITSRTLWNSAKKGTYVKREHGELT